MPGGGKFRCLLIAVAVVALSYNLLFVYANRRIAEKDLYVRSKKAEADLLVKLAKAEKVRLKNDALKGLGSERMVGLKMDDVYKGLVWMVS